MWTREARVAEEGPMTALTWPSSIRPSAIFSDVASAWMSTKMALVWERSLSTSACAMAKGFSKGAMKLRPWRFITAKGGLPAN
jgi:hypothetical protein